MKDFSLVLCKFSIWLYKGIYTFFHFIVVFIFTDTDVVAFMELL